MPTGPVGRAASATSVSRNGRKEDAQKGAHSGEVLRALAADDTAEDPASDEDKSIDELLQEAENALGEIFSVKAPRDVFGGLWSGAQCVLSGLFFGMAGVIMQPIEGLRDAGVSGCFRGVAFGLCTGLFFSVMGFCTGMFQAVRGLVVTPRALCMISKGWQWDGREARWSEPVPYSLPAEVGEVFGESIPDDDDDDADLEDTSGSNPPRRVADTYYYDVLRLTPSASQREIRKAYFTQSRQWHPDKTSEAGAKERFQAISEAYQVLSDAARRRAYDARGRPQDNKDDSFIDAKVFFSVLLGADELLPYVGRLRIAEMFGEDFLNCCTASDNDQQDPQRDAGQQTNKSGRRQLRRQVRLAASLAARLDGRVRERDASRLAERAGSEARAILQKDPSLVRFVADIGYAYRQRAELQLARLASRLGLVAPRALRLQLQSRGRKFGRQAATAKLAVSSLLKLRTLLNECDDSADEKRDSPDAATGAAGASAAGAAGASAAGAGEERTGEGGADDASSGELPASWNQALPVFMETFWSLSAHDISRTLDKVLERVLGDASVSAEVRRLRAEGLRELGAAFELEAATAAAAASRATSAGDQRSASGDGFGAADGRRAAGRSAGGGGRGRRDKEAIRRFEEAIAAAASAGAGGHSGGGPSAGNSPSEDR